MKIGDLVEWTHPHAHSVGIILGFCEMWSDSQVNIYWFNSPETSGLYPRDHKLLELVSESR